MILQWLVLPATVFMLVLFIFVIGFMMILLIKTPSMTFFKAFLTGKVVALFYRKDRRIQFQTVRLDTSCIDHDRYGVFNVVDNSVYNEVKSGSPIVTLSTDFGAALAPEMALAMRKLKDMGIKDAREAEAVERRYYHCPECKADRVVEFETIIDENTKEVTGYKPFCPDHKDVKLTKVSLTVDIGEEQKKTVTWEHVKDYVISQANPVMLKAMKERQLDSERKDLRSMIGGQAKLVGIGMAIFLSLLGVVIFYMYMNQQASTDIVGQCQALWSTWSATGGIRV